MNKQEIIKELREISSLYFDMGFKEIDNNLGNHESIADTAKVVKQIFADYDLKRPKVPQIFTDYDLFKNGPKQNSSNTSLTSPKIKKSAIIGVSVVILCTLLFKNPTVGIILGIVATIASFILIGKIGNKQSAEIADEPVKNPTWHEKYTEYDFATEMETFISECKEFDVRFLTLVDPWVELLNARKDKKSGNLADIEEAKEKLSKCTLISEEHFCIASRIANILEENRAEELGEALNIALEEVRAEEQLRATLEQNEKLEKIEKIFNIDEI